MIPVGTLEVAYTRSGSAELWRRHDVARVVGVARADDRAGRGGRPLADPRARRAARRLRDRRRGPRGRAARRAGAGGARRRGRRARSAATTEVTGFETDGRAGHRRRHGRRRRSRADVVVCCAGVWGPRLAAMVGLTLPMLAMEHQYAITTPIPELATRTRPRWATMPILRHHDGGIYYRDHGDRVGIGSFHHRGLPGRADDIDGHPRNTDGEPGVRVHRRGVVRGVEGHRRASCPRSRGRADRTRINGVFGFTPDGYPLVGEHPDLARHLGRGVGLGHALGRRRADASPSASSRAARAIDDSPADLSRFDERELDPAVVRGAVRRPVPGRLRGAPPGRAARRRRGACAGRPFADAQRELGAVFFDVATWERPQWFEANAGARAARVPARDAWSSAHWSPIAIAEHLAVRERGGVFDMTPLPRIEVTGPGAAAFLLRMVAGRCDGPVGDRPLLGAARRARRDRVRRHGRAVRRGPVRARGERSPRPRVAPGARARRRSSRSTS